MNARIRAATVVAAMLMAVFGCRPADPGVVRIVSSLPRTGAAKQQTD